MASEPMERPSDTHWRLANRALDQIEVAAGGREELVQALHHAPESEKQKLLLGLLADPRSDRAKFGTICARAGFTVGQVLTLLKEGRRARALFEAMKRVEDGLPEVAGDVMARAVPHTLPCKQCDGTGGVAQRNIDKDNRVSWTTELCPSCQGKKVEVHMPELARQKMALEIGGLLTRGPVVQVVNNQAVGVFGSQERLGLVREADEVLYGEAGAGAGAGAGADVVDAEVAGEPAEAGGDAEGD